MAAFDLKAWAGGLFFFILSIGRHHSTVNQFQSNFKGALGWERNYVQCAQTNSSEGCAAQEVANARTAHRRAGIEVIFRSVSSRK